MEEAQKRKWKNRKDSGSTENPYTQKTQNGSEENTPVGKDPELSKFELMVDPKKNQVQETPRRQKTSKGCSNFFLEGFMGSFFC